MIHCVQHYHIDIVKNSLIEFVHKLHDKLFLDPQFDELNASN